MYGVCFFYIALRSYRDTIYTMPNLTQKTIDAFKKQLEEQKAHVEKELAEFSSKNENIKGNWEAKYPQLDKNKNVNLEEEADEVEEYTIRLPIEHAMENRLEDIAITLEKIKKGTYGTCENCNKQIPLKRLKIYPEARLCLDCLASRDLAKRDATK